jgi:hypothetical protein
MTIDYLKIFVLNTEVIERLNKNPLLEWYEEKEQLSHIEEEAKEGLIKSKVSKIYKGIVFCFKEDSLIIYFKPHYFYNDNKHNANDFHVMACINILKEFLKVLQIEDVADKLTIQNIEYGLNVLSPIKIEDLITFIAYHKKNEFRTDTGLLYSKKSSSMSRRGTASKYQIIKAYAKGIQFPEYADRDIFRFEIKSQKTRKINSLGIFTIVDLLKIETYETLAEDLLKRFNEVLILDSSVNMAKLTPKKRLKLVERLNTHYWYKQQQKSRNTFNNSKEIYFNLLNEAGYNVHTDLKNILQKKINDLFYCANSHTPQIIKNCANSPIYIMRNCTINEFGSKRRCPVTGLNISMQKDSQMLSHTGLYYYFKTGRKVFDELKRKYLTGLWHNEDHKTQIKEIAHNIRNAASNRRIKQRRLYPEYQPVLFPMERCI